MARSTASYTRERLRNKPGRKTGTSKGGMEGLATRKNRSARKRKAKKKKK